MAIKLKTIFLSILVLVFSISLFKNISYPLLWNDETDAVMFGTRILTFGYPKVHDGKNKVFLVYAPGMDVGINKKYDAYTYITWGSYYYAALSELIARNFDDLYQRTAALRIPFAFIGFLGLILLALPFRRFFSNQSTYLNFLILYTLFQIFSISLVLHLRETRYFSMIVFFTSIYFILHIGFIYKKVKFWPYLILMVILLVLLFNTNFVNFAIVIFSAGLFEIILFIKEPTFNKYQIYPQTDLKNKIITFSKRISPLLTSVILIIPIVNFFEIFKTASSLSKFKKFDFNFYLNNLKSLISQLTYLHYFTFLAFSVFVYLLTYFLLVNKQVKTSTVSNKKGKVEPAKPILNFTEHHYIILLYSIFLIAYVFITCRTPYFYIRHFIVLMPLSILIALFILHVSNLMFKENTKYSKVLFGLMIFFGVVVVFVSLQKKSKMISGHLYEITHQYKGPLDLIIPYIKEKYKETDKLVIATNYEEFAYMYYLKAKVTIGYIQNNLEDDLKYQPDIIIYRKGWSWQNDAPVFNNFFKTAQYERVTLPIRDYYVNNIPDINDKDAITHQYKTLMPTSDADMVDIYIKKP